MWVYSRGRAGARQTRLEGARWRWWGGAAVVQSPSEPMGARSTAKGDSLRLAHVLRWRCSRRLHRRCQLAANAAGKGRVRGGRRRERWFYVRLRTKRLVGGGTPVAMELSGGTHDGSTLCTRV
jgi:hypothetical protein